MSDFLAFEADSFPGLELLSTNAKNCELTKADALDEFKRLRLEISRLQRVLYAENQQSLLVVFQAMDAGGKDGTIRKVFQESTHKVYMLHHLNARLNWNWSMISSGGFTPTLPLKE